MCAQDAALQRASALIGKTELTHAPLGGVIADCQCEEGRTGGGSHRDRVIADGGEPDREGPNTVGIQILGLRSSVADV
jgi:hypothetical protein